LRASRPNVASDRLLHFETVTRAPVFRRFPSAVTASSASMHLSMRFDARSGSHSRPGALRLRARPRERLSFFALSHRPPPVGRRAMQGTGRLGARRCRRDWGEPRFTARFPLRRSGRSSVRAFSSLAPESLPARLWHFCRLPLAKKTKTGSAGCLVKGVRFPGPKCLPSPVATRIPLGPKPERNREAFTFVRRSRDEDRRARVNHPPFYRTAAELPRLRA